MTSPVLFLLLLCTFVHGKSHVKREQDALEIEEVARMLEELSDENKRDIGRRIIGGEIIEQGDWPWLVSLQGKVPDRTFLGFTISSKKYYCGASLLNKRWILTAAHCFRPHDRDRGGKTETPKYWKARLGDVQLKASFWDKVKNVFGEILDVDRWKNWDIEGEKIVIHPAYSSKKTWENDIALMRLREDVPDAPEEVERISRATLPAQGDSNFPPDGERCVMKGWGCDKTGASVTSVAYQVVLPIVNNACKHTYGVSADNRICAGFNLKAKGICPGDSGGPLECKRNGKWIQVGIASFTSAKEPHNWPGAFTRVSQYVDWIRHHIDQL